MISVENLYWILFVNLLEPVGLDCYYYYPFGTRQNLSLAGEFKPLRPRQEHNVLFHYDQEPIWNNTFGSFDNYRAAWSDKLVRILANSEHSQLKNEICRDRNLLDWYFFYHGFAALDWYQDAQYIETEHQIKNAFLSFNHVFDKRAYRASLLARFFEQDIVHNGAISFHARPQDVEAELSNPNTQLSPISIDLIKKNIECFFSGLPLRLDDVPVDGNLSARFGHQEYKLWQSSLWHVVSETVFFESKLHLTEKVFKPIVAKRPFVLVAAPGNLAYLKSYGFQTFARWIDESYDHLLDPDQRLDAITHEIARFARMSMDQLHQIHHEMQTVLVFNKQHFFGKFREIIVQEMLDNFDQCLRRWNNGRVDGRNMALHPDLNAVKQILLR